MDGRERRARVRGIVRALALACGLAATAAGLAAPAGADEQPVVIELVSGERIEGVLLDLDERVYRVRIGDEVREVREREVRKLTFVQGPPGPAGAGLLGISAVLPPIDALPGGSSRVAGRAEVEAALALLQKQRSEDPWARVTVALGDDLDAMGSITWRVPQEVYLTAFVMRSREAAERGAEVIRLAFPDAPSGKHNPPTFLFVAWNAIVSVGEDAGSDEPRAAREQLEAARRAVRDRLEAAAPGEVLEEQLRPWPSPPRPLALTVQPGDAWRVARDVEVSLAMTERRPDRTATTTQAIAIEAVYRMTAAEATTSRIFWHLELIAVTAEDRTHGGDEVKERRWTLPPDSGQAIGWRAASDAAGRVTELEVGDLKAGLRGAGCPGKLIDALVFYGLLDGLATREIEREHEPLLLGRTRLPLLPAERWTTQGIGQRYGLFEGLVDDTVLAHEMWSWSWQPDAIPDGGPPRLRGAFERIELAPRSRGFRGYEVEVPTVEGTLDAEIDPATGMVRAAEATGRFTYRATRTREQGPEEIVGRVERRERVRAEPLPR